MNPLVLYTNPQSRGRIAHWMLEEIGLPYETVWLDYGAPMKADDYLAVNPMGKVPAFRHGAAVVTEAAAICAYLADCFPEKNLIPPPGHASRAPYYRWLFFAAGPLEAAVTAKALGWQVPEGKGVMAGFGSFGETLAALETALTPGPYICGEQFTAADVYVGSSLGCGLLFGSIEPRPVFTAYAERLRARPAAQQADRINEAYLQRNQA
ncbi:glutathione S-transferase family protein [Polaromonas sp.]|uniref:glutathione S-transferase family protein n=1 Tax=Polaromonas sp. TaxID=1869339 RepID=UPI0017AEF694|nr:glutathione S-transferase family protein [Polaromonas sp.]NMM08628.1 glutathione S-transferase family protein [Polaromonas sp.]